MAVNLMLEVVEKLEPTLGSVIQPHWNGVQRPAPSYHPIPMGWMEVR